MNTKNKPLVKMVILAALMLLSGLIFLTTAEAAPPAQEPLPTLAFETPTSQDPRPPVEDDPTGGAGQGDGVEDGSGSSETRCAALSGQIINWGVGGIPGIGATLSDGSWQVNAASGSDGNYGFGGLGIGVARLRIDIPPTQLLTPSVQDAGVYLNCDYPIIANIAVYSGSRIDPPATITLSAPNTIAPGAELPLKVTIKNDLPNDITNVVVTDLLPEELIALEVSTSSGSGAEAGIFEAGEDGQLVAIFFDRLGSGAEANIFITVIVNEGISRGTQINTTATLFYRESVAVQDSIELTVGTEEEPAPLTITTPEAALSATPEPDTVATPAAITETAPVSPTVTASEEENFVPPDNMPTTGDSFLPPPGLLPTTGQDTLQLSATLPETGFNPVWLPLGGFGLAGIAFICHRLRLFLRRLK